MVRHAIELELEPCVVPPRNWGKAPIAAIEALHDTLASQVEADLAYHPRYGWAVIWRDRGDVGVAWMEKWPTPMIGTASR